EDYSELINQPKTNKELYTYVLDETSERINFIERCSNKLKMKSYSKKSKYDIYSTKSSNIKDFIIPPLEEWLQGFRDAEFVITDSFHGTVFSIINKKPFISILNKERGASRFESILSKL